MNNETNVATKATKKQKKPKEPMKTSDKVSLIVGIILCAILVPILIFNCVSIITSHATNKPPSFFGNTLLFVNTGSMEPLFMKGDVIVVKTVDPDTIEVGDVISYFENGAETPTTHRVIKIEDVDGRRYATTAGDWNVSQDYETALEECETDEEKALNAKAEAEANPVVEEKVYGEPDPVEPIKEERVSLDDFGKLDLRVCEIVKCQEIRKSHSCYKITLNDGIGERVIVSSIKHDYKPEELIGKKIIVIANLEPARITGVNSNGMLLAATNNACGCKVIFVDPSVPAGTKIK